MTTVQKIKVRLYISIPQCTDIFGQEIEDEMVCFICALILSHAHLFQRLEVRRPHKSDPHPVLILDGMKPKRIKPRAIT